jgi:dienelactone hydrolase
MRITRRIKRFSPALSFSLACLFITVRCFGQVTKDDSIVHFNFAESLRNQGAAGGDLKLADGLQADAKGRLEFNRADQSAELDAAGSAEVSRLLNQQAVAELSVGGWFFLARTGEQTLVSRGTLKLGPLGERLFPPDDRFINFCLGTDERGFLRGAIQGNGSMPFVHGTINDIPAQTWQQLVVVKDKRGFHQFFQNGVLVHSDHASMWAPSAATWKETDEGAKQPLKLQMPSGGLVGEVWVLGRALSAEEVQADYEAKKQRYAPAPIGRRVETREMHIHPPTKTASLEREPTVEEVRKLLGPFPDEIVPLKAQIVDEVDCGEYVRRKVSFQVEQDDRMPGYLLIPKGATGRRPAVICFYGTTSGAGKEVTVGLSGRKPGSPPVRNMSFALDLVEAGYVAFAPDYLRDGERIALGDRPYETQRFYEKHPNWSIHGKDIWDTMRAVDYLQTLDFVDPERLGMAGHSYGGHSTIFATSLEPRIKVAVANGPVSAFREHGHHWAVPAGAAASQSLPAMRKYLLEPDLELPVTFAEWTALIAPRPLLVGQAAGERRPMEEENYGYVRSVYESLGAGESVRYIWYAGDHDFPPPARRAMVEWLDKHLRERGG